MQLYYHTLPGGAELTGYLRDACAEMPDFDVRPAVLIIPGGAYAYCSPREADPIAVQFLQAGYQTFILRYTCAGKDNAAAPLRWQPLIDAAGAILHLRRNAGKLRLDPFRIAVCGFSAGGHLAASTAILWDAAPVRKALGITGEEARPDAVILAYPVITTGEYTHALSAQNLAGEDAALRKTMSLETQVRDDLPPFFIWHTVADASVPVQNSLMLAEALSAHHIPYELHLFQDGVHGSSTCTRETGRPNRRNTAWVGLCTGWLAETFHFEL